MYEEEERLADEDDELETPADHQGDAEVHKYRHLQAMEMTQGGKQKHLTNWSPEKPDPQRLRQGRCFQHHP